MTPGKAREQPVSLELFCGPSSGGGLVSTSPTAGLRGCACLLKRSEPSTHLPPFSHPDYISWPNISSTAPPFCALDTMYL